MTDPLLLSVAPVLILGMAISAAAAPRDTKHKAEAEPIIACSLTSPELRERSAKVRRELLPTVTEVVELPNGFELVVPNEDGQLQKLAELVELESQCCGFLDFEIRLRSGSEVLSLVMTGPEGTKEVLAGMVEKVGYPK